MYVPHFAYPFLCQWTFGLLLSFDYFKWQCYEHGCTSIYLRHGFQFFWVYISGIARLYGKFRSVQLLSHATCLWSHGLKHSRLPCPSPTSGPYSNLCPLSRWCHPTISSSVPFSSRLQSFPALGPFSMSQLFASGGQNTGASASASVLPMNIQDWSPLGCTGWISLQSKGLSRVFSIPQFKSINSSALSFLCSPTLTSIHDYWKNHSLD